MENTVEQPGTDAVTASETEAGAPPSPHSQAPNADASSKPVQNSYEGVPLPDVITKLSRPGVVARLENAARRGKLAGFVQGDPEGVCSVAAFGDPFDKKLIVVAESEADGRTRLRWRMRLSPRMPALFLLILGITVFPGEPFTDSILRTYFQFYDQWVQNGLRTWYWYVPLTVIPIPFAWRWAMRRSHISTHNSAHEAVRKIAGFVGGELVEPRLKAPR